MQGREPMAFLWNQQLPPLYDPFPFGDMMYQDSTLMCTPPPPSMEPDDQVDIGPNEPKRGRGRPPGTGKKQRLANQGELMNNSAGLAFATHVITVEAGEDIVSKVFAFSQLRPRALCILSATGTVSSVVLCLAGNNYSYEGHYEIVSLGGSYFVDDAVGPKSRTGCLTASLCHPDGYLLGGQVRTLIAATLVQIVVCTFLYGSAKAKAMKQDKGSKKEEKDKIETPNSEHSPPPATTQEEAVMRGRWSGSGGCTIS